MTPPVLLKAPAAPADGGDAEWPDSPRIRLLLVDDDELYRELLATNLVDEQFDVVACAHGKACLEILSQDSQFDLILLDWRMPEISGIEVMQEIKAASITVPVVFLTAIATERNEVTALDCGAIDFLDKSRSGAVLARRIRILVGAERGAAAEASGWMDALRLGQLDIHFRVNRADWQGQRIPLTTTEFRVVQLLVSRSGEDVSYRAIYDVVHGRGFIAGDGSDGYRTNVRSLIKRIRHKFRDVDSGFEEIENYPGFGYRWRQHDEVQVIDGQETEGDGNGFAGKVFDTVAQLPFVRLGAPWRRRNANDDNNRRRASDSLRLGDAAGAASPSSGPAGDDTPLEGEPRLDHRRRGSDTA